MKRIEGPDSDEPVFVELVRFVDAVDDLGYKLHDLSFDMCCAVKENADGGTIVTRLLRLLLEVLDMDWIECWAKRIRDEQLSTDVKAALLAVREPLSELEKMANSVPRQTEFRFETIACFTWQWESNFWSGDRLVQAYDHARRASNAAKVLPSIMERIQGHAARVAQSCVRSRNEWGARACAFLFLNENRPRSMTELHKRLKDEGYPFSRATVYTLPGVAAAAEAANLYRPRGLKDPSRLHMGAKARDGSMEAYSKKSIA